MCLINIYNPYTFSDILPYLWRLFWNCEYIMIRQNKNILHMSISDFREISWFLGKNCESSGISICCRIRDHGSLITDVEKACSTISIEYGMLIEARNCMYQWNSISFNPLSGNAPWCPNYVTLSNARRFYLSRGECCHSIDKAVTPWKHLKWVARLRHSGGASASHKHLVRNMATALWLQIMAWQWLQSDLCI